MNSVSPYNSGADMWRDTLSKYGEAEARVICNNYLNMQIFSKDPEEIKFCKELYAAMPRVTTLKTEQKPSIIEDLSEKKKSVSDEQNKADERKKRQER